MLFSLAMKLYVFFLVSRMSESEHVQSILWCNLVRLLSWNSSKQIVLTWEEAVTLIFIKTAPQTRLILNVSLDFIREEEHFRCFLIRDWRNKMQPGMLSNFLMLHSLIIKSCKQCASPLQQCSEGQKTGQDRKWTNIICTWCVLRVSNLACLISLRGRS